MTLVSDIRLVASLLETSDLDLVSASAPLELSERWRLASGTGANQADKIFSDTRTLAASATEDLDLAGSLAGALGGSVVFAKIKAIYIKAASGNTNNVNVTRPASNGVPLFLAASDGIPVRPGGAFFWIAPDSTAVAVTASTGDLITLTNSSSGSSVTYDVIIIGTSA